MAICTARLALALASTTLNVLYTAFFAATALLWALVSLPTVRGFWSGRLIHAPCVAAALPFDNKSTL